MPMCGRFAITASAEHLAAVFDAMWERACLELAATSTPRYNIAPTQMVPVVRRIDSTRVLSLMRWGLVPSWADDPAIGSRLINARSETAAEKPSFRVAWRRRRCLIPASHFYEWRKGDLPKVPFVITSAAADGVADSSLNAPPLLALAGLWESWRNEFESFTILTTDANAFMRPLHDRMPVILPRERWAQWLDPSWSGPESDAERASWMAPAPEALLRSYAVSTLVNAPRNESAACLEPLGR